MQGKDDMNSCYKYLSIYDISINKTYINMKVLLRSTVNKSRQNFRKK